MVHTIGVNRLIGKTIVTWKTGPQHFMSLNKFLEAPGKRVDIQVATDAEYGAIVIQSEIRIKLFENP